ncbi:MAG: dihydroneopterin triphosphate diphosphatase [Wenzhouxiangellaceae bacterium]
MSRGRRPESVIVLIMRADGQTLMLERADWPGFWQSVTGGVEWQEDYAAAARRELEEETSLQPQRLEDRRSCRRFEIFPEYRYKYPQHIRYNDEHEFVAWVAADAPVRITPREHSAWRWMHPLEAAEATLSWSNREALLRWHWETQASQHADASVNK